jgi:predicted phage tail protein
VRTVLAVVVGAVAIVAAVFLAGLDLSETTVKEVPTMLFGLGAILLAREPRGVIYNIVNRSRLRQIEDAERRQEQAAVQAELAAAGAVS